jgi:hypothetical protein
MDSLAPSANRCRDAASISKAILWTTVRDGRAGEARSKAGGDGFRFSNAIALGGCAIVSFFALN